MDFKIGDWIIFSSRPNVKYKIETKNEDIINLKSDNNQGGYSVQYLEECLDKGWAYYIKQNAA